VGQWGANFGNSGAGAGRAQGHTRGNRAGKKVKERQAQSKDIKEDSDTQDVKAVLVKQKGLDKEIVKNGN